MSVTVPLTFCPAVGLSHLVIGVFRPLGAGTGGYFGGFYWGKPRGNLKHSYQLVKWALALLSPLEFSLRGTELAPPPMGMTWLCPWPPTSGDKKLLPLKQQYLTCHIRAS